MADNATTRLRAWNKAHAHYLDLSERLLAANEDEVDAIERELAAAESEIMELPAPSFIAVRIKLEMLWQVDLDNPDRDSAEKAQIIDDLIDLTDEAAATLGFERSLAAIC